MNLSIRNLSNSYIHLDTPCGPYIIDPRGYINLRFGWPIEKDYYCVLLSQLCLGLEGCFLTLESARIGAHDRFTDRLGRRLLPYLNPESERSFEEEFFRPSES